jgi:hypothetical protein
VRGALTGLDVLIGDVVLGLAVGGRMAALTPRASMSAWALRSVRALVAKPGSV